MPRDEEAFASPLGTAGVLPHDAPAERAKVSGRVIVALTTLPNQIFRNVPAKSLLGKPTAAEDPPWQLRHTRGDSSIYSSFYYLSQQTPWETHLVAWTGEIQDGARAPSAELSAADKSRVTEQLREANASPHIHPVWLPGREQHQARWRQYAEQVLWPVLHYIAPSSSTAALAEEWWHDYVRFNEAYAEQIAAVYRPGDVVYVHDYYLLLLPGLLKMRFPDACVGLYLHTPFPSSEYLRCLLRRTNLLEGMLGADRVGFQTAAFAHHFVSLCTRVLGCEASPEALGGSVSFYGGLTRVDTLPAGIDTAKVVRDAFAAAIDERVRAIRDVYRGKQIIVGRDRLDSVRGVAQKLEAFERFLSMYPEWRDSVVLVQVSSPAAPAAPTTTPRSGSSTYERHVAELVAYINGTYGTLHLAPVQHFQQRIDKDEYLALLRAADVGLITTIRDGMNTTALEYVACQQHNSSPLVLSEFSGAATVLDGALVVNPWDAVGVARALNEALTMSAHKKHALETKLYGYVAANTVQRSTNSFLARLVGAEDAGRMPRRDSHATPALDRPGLLRSYEHAAKRLFLFDYDGTLAPIVEDPGAAIPSARTLRLLSKLAADPRNQIWIISGRDQHFLDQWLGSRIPQLGLSAEHGCFVKNANTPQWVNLAESMDMAWQREVHELFSHYTARTPGSFIETKKVALTWHFRLADPEFGAFQAKELLQTLARTAAASYDLDVLSGKANIEVRPKFVNKGEIAKRLVLSAHGEAKTFVEEATDGNNSQSKSGDADDSGSSHKDLPDFTFCVGDDKTDEDMFKTLNAIEHRWAKSNSIPQNKFGHFGLFPTSVGVASKKTVAKAHLLDPAQVMDTLGLLVGEVSVYETAGTVVGEHEQQEEEK